MSEDKRRWLYFWLAIVIVGCVHALAYRSGEPYYNGDETRHVMTGVFFRDLIADGGWRAPRDYAISYFLQYPALGLLVWPPLFYGVEGVVMTVCGTSMIVANATVWAFCLLGCLYVFKLTEPLVGTMFAAVTVVAFALSPQVSELSRHVMLEMPTLALVLVSIFHFARYLETKRRGDIWMAAGGAAGSVLTRFDGAVVGLVLVGLFITRRQWRLLRRPELWAASIVAAAVVLPVVGLSLREYGQVLGGSFSGDETFAQYSVPLASRLAFYLRALPHQLGWPLTATALAGMVLAARTRRPGSAVFGVLAAAVYLFFTPIFELESRHAIWWTPAMCAFAAVALHWVTERRAWLGGIAAGTLLVSTVSLGAARPADYVRGCAEAAAYVVEHTTQSRYCFYDAYLNGDFIYQVRRRDVARRLTVLRGDRMLYSTVVYTTTGYKPLISNDDDILAMLHRYDPEYLVIEEPPIAASLGVPVKLRELLRSRTDEYRLEKEFPLDASPRTFQGHRLLVFHKLRRNPNPDRTLTIELPVKGGSVSTTR